MAPELELLEEELDEAPELELLDPDEEELDDEVWPEEEELDELELLWMPLIERETMVGRPDPLPQKPKEDDPPGAIDPL